MNSGKSALFSWHNPERPIAERHMLATLPAARKVYPCLKGNLGITESIKHGDEETVSVYNASASLIEQGRRKDSDQKMYA